MALNPSKSKAPGKKKNGVKMIFLDVDGTMTDGGLYISNSGEEFKKFNVQDGLGIRMAQRAGIEIVIVTGKSSRIVERRAEELGIREVFQGVFDKTTIVAELISRYRLSRRETAYMGDDLNDIPAMALCGWTFAPSSAVRVVRESVDTILSSQGGSGAVREMIELILEKQGGLSDAVSYYTDGTR